MNLVARFRAQSVATQLLLFNSFTINVGFFMIYPFLAVYLSQTLGYPAWQVGLLLGLRAFVQQGFAVIGGPLSDHLGYKPVLIAGLAARTVGFFLFAVMTDIPGIVTAAILTGLAGALFGPSSRAYFALETQPDQRTDVFALENVFVQAGALLGPLIGVVLLGFSFQLVCLVAGLIFLAVSLLQIPFLPNRAPVAGPAHELGAEWKEVVSNRPFLLFSIALLGYFTLYNQLYLGLALESRRLTGGDQAIGTIFLVSSILSLVLQLPVALYCRRHFGQSLSLAIGMATLGLAFVPPLVGAYVLPLAGETVVTFLVNFSPVVLATSILSVGLLIVRVFSNELIPHLARERLIGSYTGFFSLWSGIGSAVGNAITGAAFDARDSLNFPGLPWVFMISVGVFSGLGLYFLIRNRIVTDPN